MPDVLDDNDTSVSSTYTDIADALRNEAFTKDSATLRDKACEQLRRNQGDMPSVGLHVINLINSHAGKIDQNNDAFFSASEIKQAASKLNSADEWQLLSVLQKFKNGVDANTLKTAMTQLTVAERAARVADDVLPNFGVIDTSRDGYLTKDELEHAFLTNKKLPPHVRQSILMLLQDYDGIPDISNDEWGAEDNGVSKADLSGLKEKLTRDQHLNFVRMLREIIK